MDISDPTKCETCIPTYLLRILFLDPIQENPKSELFRRYVLSKLRQITGDTAFGFG